jgi:hypothetical protein
MKAVASGLLEASRAKAQRLRASYTESVNIERQFAFVQIIYANKSVKKERKRQF